MIQIRPIRPDEWFAAKRLIYRVAREIFDSQPPLEELIEVFESQGELSDMDDIQRGYFENGGIFLVTMDADQLVGTGAIRRFEGDMCELKRVWLLTEYHGRRLGYRMMRELLAFARQHGYRSIRLETHPVQQKRAVDFYARLGFHEVPIPSASADEDILMEMDL
jgi:putative acetyltransferase